MGTSEHNPGSSPAVVQGRVETLLVTSCYRNQDKLGADWPIDSYANFTLHQIYKKHQNYFSWERKILVTTIVPVQSVCSYFCYNIHNPFAMFLFFFFTSPKRQGG